MCRFFLSHVLSAHLISWLVALDRMQTDTQLLEAFTLVGTEP